MGQATNVFHRWNAHCKEANMDKMEISRQIKAKGVENFTFEVLEIVPDESANEAEIKWIEYYDTFYNGYNKTKGGTDHYQFMRLRCSKEDIIQYWESNPYVSCRGIAHQFGLHHETVSGILHEFGKPVDLHGKQRIVLLNEITGETFEFASRSDGARYILETESWNVQVRTVQKRLSDQLRYKHYTVIEYYKGEGEEIVHPH